MNEIIGKKCFWWFVVFLKEILKLVIIDFCFCVVKFMYSFLGIILVGSWVWFDGRRINMVNWWRVEGSGRFGVIMIMFYIIERLFFFMNNVVDWL